MALLSRTAENLFWIGRYVERAENMARLLETGKRMSAVPTDDEVQPEWEPVLSAAGVLHQFNAEYDTINQRNAVDFVAFSRDNPSSIVSTIAAARANARSIRTAFTIDMWEAINEFWLSIRDIEAITPGQGHLIPFLDQVKQNCALFRGVSESTALRNDGYDFLRLGMFIERADCTARILDVKYFALLDPQEEVAGSVDTYQWAVILRATSSLRSFNWVYGCGYDLDNIVDFLVLNTQSPRSLAYCIENVTRHLDRLSRLYAERHDCHEICASIQSELNSNGAEEIIQEGLHEFLTRFVARNNWLSTQIGRDYHFASMAALGAEAELEVLADERSAEPPVTQAQS